LHPNAVAPANVPTHAEAPAGPVRITAVEQLEATSAKHAALTLQADTRAQPGPLTQLGIAGNDMSLLFLVAFFSIWGKMDTLVAFFGVRGALGSLVAFTSSSFAKH